jgi:hypothetical protein
MPLCGIGYFFQVYIIGRRVRGHLSIHACIHVSAAIPGFTTNPRRHCKVRGLVKDGNVLE